MGKATTDPFRLSDELREALTNLADGLLPLASWLGEPTKYIPSQSDLPWREASRRLSAKDMGLIDFFEELVRSTAGEAALLVARWAQFERNGPSFVPIKDLEHWRTARGLAGSAAFAITQSGNVLLDGEGRPVVRAAFYAPNWPPLLTTVRARKPANAAAWEALAVELFSDQCPEWPTSSGLKSSTFVAQFVRDLLYAMLGMRGPARDPWAFAVLIELGEHRRVGNAYTPEDVRKTVFALRARIAAYAAKAGR